MKARLTRLADRDVEAILSDTKRLFGPRQVVRYSSIIEQALQWLCDDPLRPASRAHDEFGPGVRAFPLRLASGRTAGAAHVVYYLPNDIELLVLRVLPESMLPGRRVIAAVKDKQ